MKNHYTFLNTSYYFIFLFLLLAICWPAYSQQQTDEGAVYMLKKDWSIAKNIKEATYFMQVLTGNDTAYTCRYYNRLGSMIRQESYFDSMLTIPDGRFCWYDEKGMLDSTGMVNKRIKTGVWKYYDDNGEPTLAIVYDNGRIIERKDLRREELTDEKATNTPLTAKEKIASGAPAAGNDAAETKFKNVSFGEPDAAEQWNEYLKKSIRVPERFSSIYNNSPGIAAASFTINKEGKPTDVYLTRSCEWSADNEVLNAITKSTGWKLAGKYEDSINYEMQQAITFYSYADANEDSSAKGIIIGAAEQATFPGGQQGWIQFLKHNLNADVTANHNAPAGEYTVVVSFLAGKDGTISELKATTNPGYGTAEEAIRVLKKGPKWIPATIDGEPVTYRQKQAITFVVAYQ